MSQEKLRCEISETFVQLDRAIGMGRTAQSPKTMRGWIERAHGHLQLVSRLVRKLEKMKKRETIREENERLVQEKVERIRKKMFQT